MSSSPYFHEDQYFRQSWIWLLITVPIVITAVALMASPRGGLGPTVVTLIVGALLVALFVFARLETEVGRDAVVIRFRGLWPTRRIALDQIIGAEARRYSMWESGGWGVHWTFSGWTYNVSGNEGVFIRLRKGSRVIVGSQRAHELAAAIQRARGASSA